MFKSNGKIARDRRVNNVDDQLKSIACIMHLHKSIAFAWKGHQKIKRFDELSGATTARATAAQARALTKSVANSDYQRQHQLQLQLQQIISNRSLRGHIAAFGLYPTSSSSLTVNDYTELLVLRKLLLLSADWIEDESVQISSDRCCRTCAEEAVVVVFLVYKC